MNQEPKFRIAIVGGGIGGAALASMLANFGDDIDAHVYEASSRFGEIGAGLTVWPRTLRIFDHIGLGDGDEGYLKYATTYHPKDIGHCLHRSDQGQGTSFFQRKIPGGITSFHRAKLLDLFASGISSSQVHFNKQLASYIHTETGVRLLFKDGSEANADALIAADGVNSTVRRLVLDSYIKRATTDADRMAIEQLKRPFWTRTVAYRALLDPERLRKINSLHPSLTTPHHYCGYRAHCVTYPIDGGHRINFVTCNREPELAEGEIGQTYDQLYNLPPTKAELVAKFKGWDADVQALLECVDSPTRWPIWSHRPHTLWTDNRVVLTGDAAHAMPPHNGAGAGMAIEDAFVLATILAHPLATRETLPIAFKAFEKARIPTIHRAMQGSEACGYIYEFMGKYGSDLSKVGLDMLEHTAWIEDFDLEKVKNESVQVLRDMLV